jgi:signal transduction histidine kinase
MEKIESLLSGVSDEQQLQQLLGRFARLLSISAQINSTLDFDALLQSILETAVGVLECEIASIMLYDDNRGELIFTASTDPQVQNLLDVPVPIDGSLAGAIFCDGESLLVNDVKSDPRHFSDAEEQTDFRSRSLVGVPMTIQEKHIGVLQALNKKQSDFTAVDLHLLSVIASQAAAAINNSRLHIALRQAFDEVSKVDQLRTNFMALASHELRTPLGIVLGYATFLKDDADDTLSEHADAVLNAALQLQTIVEDMTNMNYIQMGAVRLKTRPEPVQRIVAKVYKDVAEAARAKEQTFLLDIEKELLFVETEPSKLELVFTNILNNAIRFTPIGGKISVRVYPRGGEAWVEIADSGIGIPEDKLASIFDDFYQVEDHMTRKYGGMGLGLSIVKGLIDLHGGRVWAESDGINKGSSFIVVLPLVDSD